MIRKHIVYRQIQINPKSFVSTLSIQPTNPIPTHIKIQWNEQLKELSKSNRYNDSLILYLQMLRSGQTPNAFTFPFVLKSCASLSLLSTGQQIHSQVLRTGNSQDTFVKTSLISLYVKCFMVESARKVFDEMPLRFQPTVCFNALIAGYTLNNRASDSVSMFYLMRLVGVAFDEANI